MREYSVTRSTMEWNRIMRQIKGDPPMRRDKDDLSELADDIEQMLKHDNTYVGGTQLPKRTERK